MMLDDQTSPAEDELFELEFSPEDVAYYLVDEHDNEIGVAVYDADGNTVEYFYEEGSAPTTVADSEAASGSAANSESADKSTDDTAESTLSRAEIKDTAQDLRGVLKDGKETVSELKEAYDDLKGLLDFKNLLKQSTSIHYLYFEKVKPKPMGATGFDMVGLR